MKGGPGPLEMSTKNKLVNQSKNKRIKNVRVWPKHPLTPVIQLGFWRLGTKKAWMLTDIHHAHHSHIALRRYVGFEGGVIKSQIFLSFQTHLDGSDSILKLGNLSWDSDFENPHFWGSVFVCSWFLGLGLDSKFLRQRTSHRQGHMTFSEWETLNESIKPPNDSIHYPYPPLINLRICPLPPHTTVIHYGDLITTLSFIFGLTLKYNVTHQKTVTFSKAPTK